MLSENQQKRIDLLSEETLKLEKKERRLFAYTLREKMMKASNIDLAKLNVHWPEIRQFGKHDLVRVQMLGHGLRATLDGSLD